VTIWFSTLALMIVRRKELAGLVAEFGRALVPATSKMPAAQAKLATA
jgi:hypothetical protein